VTTVLNTRRDQPLIIRAAAACRVGGAKPDNPISASAATNCWAALWASIS
jgi:hypothetical protein